jgi:RNA polymerase sigma-70 factor, ECF subfamily
MLAVTHGGTSGELDGSGPRVHPAVPAFDRVYEAHFDFVWRSARRLGVADEALDDVAQEIFLVVHRKLGEFEGRSSLRTWLYAIARRVVSDHRRSARRKRPHTELPDTLSSSATPHGDVVRHQAASILHAFLDALPDEQREVFVLAELEQMTAPEIAEATSAPVNTVYSRLRLARQAFERCVARHRARLGRES